MITESTASELRETGISVIGDVRWGTHFCYFYETKRDLLETLVLYFKTGLESNEFCVWVVSAALTVEEAKHALAQAMPDLERHLAEGDLEIHSHDEWYLSDGRWDPQRVLQSWREKLNQTSANGHAGLRASGDGGWIQNDDWMAFREYEKQVDVMIADQRSIILCTYPLTTSRGDQVFDVAHIHRLAVARRDGSWEVIETPGLKEAKAEIKRLNQELEQKVEERTKQLAATNRALQEEIDHRKQAEEQLAAYAHLLQTFSRRLFEVQEEERRHLARELHDEIGQALTAAKINLQSVAANGDSATYARLQETTAILDRLLGQVRQISLDLRPSMLDDLGLVPALRSLIDQQGRRASVPMLFSAEDLPQSLDAKIQTTCFRIAQEAITNALRHAHATRVNVALRCDNGNLQLVIEDNGIGFDAESAHAQMVGLGLIGIKERAALIGGSARIISSPNKGTTIKVLLPLMLRREATSRGLPQ